MIRRTFQVVRGIGPAREKELWSKGILSWDDFPAPGAEPAFSSSQDERVRAGLERASDLLAKRDLQSLSRLLPARERWRLYREFADRAAFFDIETDGTPEQVPTVVSIFHREGFEVFIRGRNLESLPSSLGRWPLWITFNGTGFDVPVLERHFPDMPKPALHLDLRHVCQRFGLRGGLKKLEGLLGFGRPPRLTGVNGFDAVLLWRAFRAGEQLALRMLVEYNLYDSIQLRTLMETVYNRGVALSGTGAPSLEVFRRGDVLLDISKYLLKLAPDDGDDAAMLSTLRGQLPPS